MHTEQSSCPLFSLVDQAGEEQLKLNFSSFKLEAKDAALFLFFFFFPCLQLRAHWERAHQQPSARRGVPMCQRTADTVPPQKIQEIQRGCCDILVLVEARRLGEPFQDKMLALCTDLHVKILGHRTPQSTLEKALLSVSEISHWKSFPTDFCELPLKEKARQVLAGVQDIYGTEGGRWEWLHLKEQDEKWEMWGLLSNLICSSMRKESRNPHLTWHNCTHPIPGESGAFRHIKYNHVPGQIQPRKRQLMWKLKQNILFLSSTEPPKSNILVSDVFWKLKSSKSFIRTTDAALTTWKMLWSTFQSSPFRWERTLQNLFYYKEPSLARVLLLQTMLSDQ